MASRPRPTDIEQACYWLAHLPKHDPRPLDGPAEHDLVVVGGGLTGLWAALFLKELDPARDVAVVEQGIAAWGASGRNAGMLAETIDHTHGLAIQHFGAAEAARLATLGEQNVKELTGFIRDRAIDCHYEPSGRNQVFHVGIRLGDRSLGWRGLLRHLFRWFFCSFTRRLSRGSLCRWLLCSDQAYQSRQCQS